MPQHTWRRTEPGPIRKILTHLGEPLEPSPVSPARGPPTFCSLKSHATSIGLFPRGPSSRLPPRSMPQLRDRSRHVSRSCFCGRSRGRRWHPSRRQAGSRRRAARRRHRDGRPTTRCVRAAGVATPGSGVAPPLAAKLRSVSEVLRIAAVRWSISLRVSARFDGILLLSAIHEQGIDRMAVDPGFRVCGRRDPAGMGHRSGR